MIKQKEKINSNPSISFDELIKSIEIARKEGGVDLSTTEDLSLAVMNLISLEEHFFFTAMKTNKNEYFDTAEEVRSMRKDLLAELMPNHEGETWCASKHLLATTMRLVEVGNKLQSGNEKEKAIDMYKRAYKTYSIFWALKLKLVNVKKSGKIAGEDERLEDLVTKLADCCKE